MSSEPQPDRQPPNPARVALWSFVAGVIIWVGGACLVLRGGGSGISSPSRPVIISTQAAARATATALPDRTSCDAIRGTDYRSPAERQFFLQNCQP
jgi:hypothetical protein